ncbi:MAG: sodium:solute symporter family protein [Clostridia bacterium]|nr:sodium:solute symporter family protein [Clostridia bacterium]
MTLSVWHILGILLTLVLIAGVSAYSGKKVKSASDFSTGGGKAGSLIVAGTIMGTLVSGQATIGTAQLAFTFGMSAWWFTLGSGIGCLILALGYAKSLRHSGQTTLLGVISAEYGRGAGYTGSVLSSLGIFFSMISQMLACTALLTAIFPINALVALLISITLMAVYVIFGGVWGAGMGGVVKLVLLYVACGVGAVIVISLAGGFDGLMDTLRSLFSGTPLGELSGIKTDADVSDRFTSLIARGAGKDIGSGLSLLLGVLSTQTYAQAIWSAKTDKAAKRGALISALLIPPIGIACILIGLYMRGNYITSDEIQALLTAGQAIPEGLKEIASASQAFPMFILNHVPKLLGGIVLGTLLITIVGGGSGLSLGVATIAVNDIIKKLTRKLDEPKKALLATRIAIVIALFAAAAVAFAVPGAIINDFGFLSMGLRGAVVFIPLSYALFLKGRVDSRCVFASIIAGPVAVLLGNLLSLPFDSLFLGMAVCVLCVAASAFIPKKKL